MASRTQARWKRRQRGGPLTASVTVPIVSLFCNPLTVNSVLPGAKRDCLAVGLGLVVCSDSDRRLGDYQLRADVRLGRNRVARVRISNRVCTGRDCVDRRVRGEVASVIVNRGAICNHVWNRDGHGLTLRGISRTRRADRAAEGGCRGAVCRSRARTGTQVREPRAGRTSRIVESLDVRYGQRVVIKRHVANLSSKLQAHPNGLFVKLGSAPIIRSTEFPRIAFVDGVNDAIPLVLSAPST